MPVRAEASSAQSDEDARALNEPATSPPISTRRGGHLSKKGEPSHFCAPGVFERALRGRVPRGFVTLSLLWRLRAACGYSVQFSALRVM